MFFLILLMASCSFNNEHTWANLYVYTAKSTTLPTWSPTQKSRVTSATLVAKATTVQLTSRSTGLGSTPQVWPSANTTFFPARFCFFDNRKIPHQIDPERFSRLVQSSCEKSRWKIFLLWWPNSTLDADEKLICSVCGKIYHCPETYRKHLQSHTYVWPCTLCERTFSWQSSLRSHMETTHSQTRGFACGSCASAFKLKGHLRRHCQNTGHLFPLSK